MKHICSFSGGKDSMAMIMMMIEKNMKIDEVVYCDVGMEFGVIKNMRMIFERYLKKNIGIGITVIKAEKNWDDYFYQVRQKGEWKGKIYGWPMMAFNAWCNDRLKIKPLNKYFNSQGEHIRYIGIARNEPSRYAKLQDNARAPLFDWGVDEEEVIQYLKSKGWYFPIYDDFDRLGCWCCPKQSLDSLRIVRNKYYYCWQKMLKYDMDSPVTFKSDGTTVHDLEKRFAKEEAHKMQKIRKVRNNQVTLFCKHKIPTTIKDEYQLKVKNRY